MGNSAIIRATGKQVTIVGVNGGWTTIMDAGVESKVRNSALGPAEIETLYSNPTPDADNFEVERDESDDPDHNDVEMIADVPEGKIRRVKEAQYNTRDMRKLKSAKGHTSYDCGDSLARLLEGKSIEEVYSIAADRLGVSQTDLTIRYEHLNPGMQRMNLGNRIRAAASKAARAQIEQLKAEQDGKKRSS